MMVVDDFKVGARIGDYVIDRVVGDGYEATHVLLPRRVRLEVMHPTFVGLRPVAVRMMREACILEALQHPGVPRVYEVGLLEDHRTAQPWVASELAEGELLAHTLEHGPLPVREVVALLRNVADVLAHAHTRGVAHRALCADTITRGGRGFPICVARWGDARIPDREVDADRWFADDVRALGIVAYQALTGKRPNGSRTTRCAGVPPRLAWLIDDLLVPNPMSRSSAAEVCARAELVAEGLEAGDEDHVAMAARPPALDASRTPRLRTRWTPPHGVYCHVTPRSNAISIGILKPRS